MRYLLLLFLFFAINANSQNSELDDFIDDLFYDLPIKKSAYTILKEMNKSEFITDAKVGDDVILSKIIENPILDLNNDSELLVFFDDKVSTQKRILIHNQIDKSNFYTIFNLLKSFDLTFRNEKGIDGNNEADIYYFWKDKNKGPILVVSILPFPKFDGKIKSTITISLNEKNID
ncbi:hypothetical protein [Hanstruepera ponticola]|uniref:hypothetical protein n=1 Tax=Hanstruepera ponticola TaxID=2042995 RepID=UPI00177E052F|nr:hypothetical protein [Hanstruepera ponticola]